MHTQYVARRLIKKSAMLTYNRSLYGCGWNKFPFNIFNFQSSEFILKQKRDAPVVSVFSAAHHPRTRFLGQRRVVQRTNLGAVNSRLEEMVAFVEEVRVQVQLVGEGSEEAEGNQS